MDTAGSEAFVSVEELADLAALARLKRQRLGRLWLADQRAAVLDIVKTARGAEQMQP